MHTKVFPTFNGYCKECNNKIDGLKKSDSIYCSVKCRSNFNAKRYHKKHYIKKTPLTRKCQFCKRSFKPYNGQVFCSKKCNALNNYYKHRHIKLIRCKKYRENNKRKVELGKFLCRLEHKIKTGKSYYGEKRKGNPKIRKVYREINHKRMLCLDYIYHYWGLGIPISIYKLNPIVFNFIYENRLLTPKDKHIIRKRLNIY